MKLYRLCFVNATIFFIFFMFFRSGLLKLSIKKHLGESKTVETARFRIAKVSFSSDSGIQALFACVKKN